jgi:hypothetical protein
MLSKQNSIMTTIILYEMSTPKLSSLDGLYFDTTSDLS